MVNTKQEKQEKQENRKDSLVETDVPAMISEKSDWTTEEEGTSFPEIDRKEEDKNVLLYQKTGDEKILTSLYEMRVPTLKKWARQYYYLSYSEEDMFAEFRQVFLKAVDKYRTFKKKKVIYGREVWVNTPFNTYLWYALDHFVKNIRNGKRAKKRRLLGTDPNSISNFVLSLDYDYNNDGDSSLMDLISNSIEVHHNVMEKASMDDTVNILSSNDSLLKEFLTKLSYGESISALLKEYKLHRGSTTIDENFANRLKKSRKARKVVYNFLLENIEYGKRFKLVNYSLDGSQKLNYVIELHKTPSTDKIAKALRNIKKNKDYFINRLSYC